jgi:hypothetical protein
MSSEVAPPLDRENNDASRIALFYLARGADEGFLEMANRFAGSYRRFPPGVAHRLVLILKGFASEKAMNSVRHAFANLPFEEAHTSDDAFDLGAYRDAVSRVDCGRAAFLNTGSEPLSANWLAKLDAALNLPGIGVAGATGSFEAGVGGCEFPNVHVRTNAFMMPAPLAREILGELRIVDKRDAHLAEHGLYSLTRKIIRRGLAAVIVGANGRAYAPEWWSGSRTFRQGDQANLLVADNQTRRWDEMTWPERKASFDATWGNSRTPGRPFCDPRS